MTRWEIAAPGTPADGPGWKPVPPGFTLAWRVYQGRPMASVAVKRDGILVEEGFLLQQEEWEGDAMTVKFDG